MFIISQMIRFIASVLGIAADADLNKKRMYILNGIGNALTAISYFMINAITGGIGSTISVLRNIYVYFSNKRPSTIVAIIYSIIVIAISIPEINGIVSIIPIVIVLLYSWALFSDSMKLIKLSIIIVDILGILYDFYVGAPVGVVANALSLILTVISEIKYFKKNEEFF
ncbi:MAG: YgjV family protein [Clostridia bacterium]|nr:YgjV family protein [Clostridia bacterium]